MGASGLSGLFEKDMTIAIRYIAMQDETLRIQFMEDWLVASGLSFARSDGVRVNSVDEVDSYDSQKRKSRFGYDLTASEIGCFLAHRNCWLECLRIGEPMLILESDVGLKPRAVLGDLLTSLGTQRQSFDIVRFHGIFEHNEFLRRFIGIVGPNFSLYQCVGDPMGGGAYLITPHAAEVLVNKSASFFQPLDVFLGSTWFHRLRFRTVKPYPFYVKEFESEIGDRKRPKQSVLDRLGIEAHRCVDDLKRISYMPIDFFR